MSQELFPYSEADLEYLSVRNARLGEAIRRIGRIDRAVIPDLFSALVNSIVGQQISMKAHATVWNRVLMCVSSVTPEGILLAGEDALRGCGLSGRKVRYILSAAEAVHHGELDLERLRKLPDQEVVDALVRLPGIGVWTAEMLLIFSLCRKDVFSTRDFGIRRGISILYEDPAPDERMFAALRDTYAPLASVASLYLWEISSRIK